MADKDDQFVSNKGQAPGAKPTSNSLSQKIKENAELQMSWADMIDEFESNGVTIDHGIDTKIIVSGPPT